MRHVWGAARLLALQALYVGLFVLAITGVIALTNLVQGPHRSNPAECCYSDRNP